MNLSATVMLFEENGVRPCKVEYDPDIARNNNPNVLFKCVDPTVVKGDLVIVQTNTRHGFTIARVTAIGYADVPVDFEAPTQWGWVAGKFDVDAFEDILATEKKLTGMVAEANANMMRAKLRESMGVEKVSLNDVFIKRPVAIASPHGTEAATEEVVEPAPSPDTGI